MFNYWAKNYDHVPDGVVVEGPMAGGHLGFHKEDLDKEEFIHFHLIPCTEVIKKMGTGK